MVAVRLVLENVGANMTTGLTQEAFVNLGCDVNRWPSWCPAFHQRIRRPPSSLRVVDCPAMVATSFLIKTTYLDQAIAFVAG